MNLYLSLTWVSYSLFSLVCFSELVPEFDLGLVLIALICLFQPAVVLLKDSQGEPQVLDFGIQQLNLLCLEKTYTCYNILLMNHIASSMSNKN